VGERIAEGVLGLLAVHSSAIRLLQPEGALTAISLGGRAKEYPSSCDTVPAGVGLVGRAAAEGRPNQQVLATQAERLRILHEIDRALIAQQAPEAIAEAVVQPLRELLVSDQAAGRSGPPGDHRRDPPWRCAP